MRPHPTLHRILSLLVTSLICATAQAQLPADTKSDLGPDVPPMLVRPGFRVTRALPAGKLQASRFLQFSPDGKTLYCSDRENGTIYALSEPDADGVFQKVTNFVSDKATVQGMANYGGWLYFSQAGLGSVSRARDTNGDGVADDVEIIIPRGGLPSGGGHPFEGLLVTEKEIYVTASDPSNYTEELNSDRKTIYVFDIDGKNRRVFCTGIRNTEKLRFRPGTTEIWGFDHGSDNFGMTFGETMNSKQPITDLNPPEELNLYAQDGFYGHPYIMGNGVPRPELSKKEGIDIIDLAAKTTQPKWLVHAHWAVLGFTFVEKEYFPGAKGDLFFASHGSWNSTNNVGAVIQRVTFDPVTGLPYGSMTIVDCQDPSRTLSARATQARAGAARGAPGARGPARGAQGGSGRYARPVDLAEAPDGSLVFSSDEPPALYRISKSK